MTVSTSSEQTFTEQMLNPGSAEALNRGCRCPVLDNAYGKGRGCDGARFGWWINADCPLHVKQ